MADNKVSKVYNFGITKLLLLTLLLVFTSVFSSTTFAQAATPKLGAKCTNLNEVQLVKSEILMCMTSKKGWTWQSMGSTSATPTKSVQTLPLVLTATRKQVAQINTYVGCLHTNGLPAIKTLSDIWAIDPNIDQSKKALDACSSLRPDIANKPANKYVPAQESSTKREIKIIVIGKTPKIEAGNQFQCNTGLGNFSITWGITNKPLYPSFIATTDGTQQSLAYLKATIVDASTMTLENITPLAVGKYLTCVVSDPAGSTYLGSSSVLITKP
jgi:hypothetical protein